MTDEERPLWTWRGIAETILGIPLLLFLVVFVAVPIRLYLDGRKLYRWLRRCDSA